MDDLQAQIQSYGNSLTALQSYQANQDKDFFDDWMSKTEMARKNIENIGSALEGIPASLEGAKLLKKTGQYLYGKATGAKTGDSARNERAGDDEEGDDDTGGANEGGSGETGTGTGGADNGAEEGGGDDGFIEDDPLGTEGGSGFPAGSLSDRAVTQDLPEDFEPPVGGGGTAPSGEASAASDGAGADGGSGGVGAADQGTQADQAGDGGEEDAGDDAEQDAGDAGEEAGGDAGDALGDLAPDVVPEVTGGLSEALGGAATALSTGLEFLSPIGLLAGLGMAIYEAVDKPKPPPPPSERSASQKSELVVPTLDMVQDAPASYSAF